MTPQGKKILLLLAIIVLIALAFFLGRLGKNNVPTDDNNNTGDQNATTTEDQQPVSEIYKLNDVTIQIPETTDTVQLSSGRGRFVTPGTPFFTEVRLSEPRIEAYSPTGNKYYIAPFGVDTGGTGYFMYLGLFTADTPSSPQHIDSVFLGDRILVDGISYKNDNSISLELLVRKDDEPMVAQPTVPVEYTFIIQNNSLARTDGGSSLMPSSFGGDVSSSTNGDVPDWGVIEGGPQDADSDADTDSN